MGRIKIIAFITEGPIIQKILKHLGLWEEETSRTKAGRPGVCVDFHRRCFSNVFPLHQWETLGWEYPDQPDVAGIFQRPLMMPHTLRDIRCCGLPQLSFQNLLGLINKFTQ